jgi:hypothetical protein
LFAVQVGCDTFTQLFTQHPEVLDYLADYDTMVLEGINIGEALRYLSALKGQCRESRTQREFPSNGMRKTKQGLLSI